MGGYQLTGGKSGAVMGQLKRMLAVESGIPIPQSVAAASVYPFNILPGQSFAIDWTPGAARKVRHAAARFGSRHGTKYLVRVVTEMDSNGTLGEIKRIRCWRVDSWDGTPGGDLDAERNDASQRLNNSISEWRRMRRMLGLGENDPVPRSLEECPALRGRLKARR